MKTERTPKAGLKTEKLTLTRANRRNMQEYAKVTGRSNEEAINHALKDWFHNLGSAELIYAPNRNA